MSACFVRGDGARCSFPNLTVLEAEFRDGCIEVRVPATQTSQGTDMNGYADDLAGLFEALDLRDAVLVGHSTRGGEVVRYLGRHGSKRVAKVVLIAAAPPIMLQTDANPEGLPMKVFDDIRAGLAGDRSQFYKDLAVQFYGANRPGAQVAAGTLEQF